MADEPHASSSSAFDLGALGRKLRQEQDGSAERKAYLEKLRKRVKAGEYRVDAEELANKLLETAADQIVPGHCPDDDPEEAK
jgi:anti-sigma28 factor (negative regulator of flagellin synthesis)